MAPVAHFTARIIAFRKNGRIFARVGRRRHLRAARLARRALALKAKGFHLRAARVMQRALRVKAAAARAMFRSRLNHARAAALRARTHA